MSSKKIILPLSILLMFDMFLKYLLLDITKLLQIIYNNPSYYRVPYNTMRA